MRLHLQRFQLYNCILPLLLSLLIYLLFRTEDTLINKLANLHLSITYFSKSLFIPNWVIYNLPGSLWLFAFLSVFIVKDKKGLFFCLIPLMGALMIEFMQYLKITDGTFDRLDVLFYILTWSIFMLIRTIKGNKIPRFYSSEKISTAELSILILFLAIVILSDVY